VSAQPPAEQGKEYEDCAALVDAPAFGKFASGLGLLLGGRVVVLGDDVDERAVRPQRALVFLELPDVHGGLVPVVALFAETVTDHSGEGREGSDEDRDDRMVTHPNQYARAPLLVVHSFR
jgi:hypothetical protein